MWQVRFCLDSSHADIEKVKVTKREIFKRKKRQALLCVRELFLLQPSASLKSWGHHSLSISRLDRSETNDLHKRPDTRGIQRHKKTDNDWSGGREEHGERAKWRGPRRDVPAKSREWMGPRGVSQKTRTKFLEQNSVKELKRLKKAV